MVFEMFLGLFVLLIRVSDSCCVLKALPPGHEPPVPLVFFVFYVPYQSIGIGEIVKSLFKPPPFFIWIVGRKRRTMVSNEGFPEQASNWVEFQNQIKGIKWRSGWE